MTTRIDTVASPHLPDAQGPDLGPYARWIGFELLGQGDELHGRLRISEDLIGNPQLQILHGGVLATLLQLTGVGIVMEAMNLNRRPRLLSSTVQFLGAAQAVDTCCRGRILTRSRRFATVQAAIFQDASNENIASATLHFLLVE